MPVTYRANFTNPKGSALTHAELDDNWITINNNLEAAKVQIETLEAAAAITPTTPTSNFLTTRETAPYSKDAPLLSGEIDTNFINLNVRLTELKARLDVLENPSSPIEALILSYNPTAYYRFEETSGIDLTDTSSNSNDAVLNEGVSSEIDLNIAGAFNSGVGLASTSLNDKINLPNVTAISDAKDTDFTIGVWLNPSSAFPGSGNTVNLFQQSPFGSSISFSLSAFLNDLECIVELSSQSAISESSNLSLSSGTWTFLAMTYNVTTKIIKLYQNGVELNYGAQVAGSGTTSSATFSYIQGGWTDDHIIDEWFLIPSELTAANLLEIYNLY